MKVKIIKCSKDTYWYADMIGEVFDVIEDYPRSHEATNPSYCIKKFPDGCYGWADIGDCVVLPDSYTSLENKLKITDAILTVFYNQDTHKMEYQILIGDEQYETDNEEEMYKIMDIACELAEYKSSHV